MRSDLISPDLPSAFQDQVLGWIEYSFASLNPEVDAETEAQFESFATWSSPSARVHAAEAALDVTLKLPDAYPRLKPSIDRALADPHSAVRLNAALRLVRIWDIDREGFWQRAAEVIAREENRAVLDNFITGTA